MTPTEQNNLFLQIGELVATTRSLHQSLEQLTEKLDMVVDKYEPRITSLEHSRTEGRATARVHGVIFGTAGGGVVSLIMSWVLHHLGIK